jgi:hypothetical protein
MSSECDCTKYEGKPLCPHAIKSMTDQIRELHEGHLRVCNFFGVWGEDCDVCAWSRDVMRILDGEQ